MPVTIYDIAEGAQVSIATVSRAFNGHPRVSDATRERVFEVARESKRMLLLSEAHASKQLHGLATHPTDPDRYRDARAERSSRTKPSR